jgi:hypothetical protein
VVATNAARREKPSIRMYAKSYRQMRRGSTSNTTELSADYAGNRLNRSSVKHAKKCENSSRAVTLTLGSARALACPFRRPAEMLLFSRTRRTSLASATTAREGACGIICWQLLLQRRFCRSAYHRAKNPSAD